MFNLIDKCFGEVFNLLRITNNHSLGDESDHIGERITSIDRTDEIGDTTNDNSNIWKLNEISEQSQCLSLELPQNLKGTKISKLIYTSKGDGILILATNAVHLLWKWQCSEHNLNGMATASVSPELYRPSSGVLMINDACNHDPEEYVGCCALSKNDKYIVSASGGKMYLFNAMTFKKMRDVSLPSRATFVAFYPKDNNVMAVGMDDATIRIYYVHFLELKRKLEGHSKRITGLAFSDILNILVSTSADAQICVWSCDEWKKQNERYLQFPTGKRQTGDTWVQFHHDQIQILVAHETQLAIYETTQLECVKQWVRHESAAPISHATFSCDGEVIYASFLDATVCIFTVSHLHMLCRINPSAYLSPDVGCVHPIVIAGNPQKPNQLALGLSDGRVYVLESEAKWGLVGGS